MIKKDVRSQAFPPVSQQCPDGWTYGEIKGGTGNSVITAKTCTSASSNLGTASGTAMRNLFPNRGDITQTGNFKTNGWGISMKPGVTVCQQRNWAKRNGVSWDGVSNYNGCD
jgi:hypothetical protein